MKLFFDMLECFAKFFGVGRFRFDNVQKFKRVGKFPGQLAVGVQPALMRSDFLEDCLRVLVVAPKGRVGRLLFKSGYLGLEAVEVKDTSLVYRGDREVRGFGFGSRLSALHRVLQIGTLSICCFISSVKSNPFGIHLFSPCDNLAAKR